MNVDLPPWVSHGGQSVASVDIDGAGRRVATAGSDAKVKVWSLVPLLSARAEQDEARHPKLLATLTDHCAPVNTVRFAASGKLLATCSDDRVAFIFELHPGPGKTVFGSSDQPSLENWRPVHSLRGHSNNVMDVAWSPDDSMVATCSLDNSVMVWTAAGKQLAVLEGHSSYVKGVAWDPIGSYLASQSDDKSVAIWRCSDWTLLQRITAPFQHGFLTQTFTLRLGWTPNGQHLVAPNSFQSPSHCAAVVSRDDWACPLTVVGHRAAVTAVRFCPLLFRARGPDGEEEDPATCFALGSQDKRVTVWLSSGDRPRVILDRIFSQSVADLAWAADGLTLLACSADGSVAVLRLEPGALGQPLSAEERQQYMQSKYGARPAGRVLLAESAAQLGLETAGSSQPQQPQQPPQQQPQQPQAQAPAQAAARPAPARPSRRELGDGVPHPSEFPQARRIAPIPVGAPASAPTALPNGPGREAPRPLLPAATPPQAARRETPAAGSRSSARATGLPPPPPPPRALTAALGSEPQLGGRELPLSLEVANEGGVASVSCRCGGEQRWADALPGAATAAAGSRHFSAITFQDGSLQVFTAGGRHMLPAMRLAAVVTHLACDGAWRLLAVLLDGTLRLWDLREQRLVVSASLAGLRSTEVLAARLSEGGSPLVLLADGSAHVLHLPMQEWLRVIDPSSTGLPYSTAIEPAAGQGELGALEAEARASTGTAPLPAPGGGRAARRQLEQKLAAARALGSPQELRRWLLTYVRWLAAEADEGGRLRELCGELLGPLRGGGPGDPGGGWQPEELGLRKRDLLREVLREAASLRTHQGLVAEFSEQLATADKP